MCSAQGPSDTHHPPIAIPVTSNPAPNSLSPGAASSSATATPDINIPLRPPANNCAPKIIPPSTSSPPNTAHGSHGHRHRRKRSAASAAAGRHNAKEIDHVDLECPNPALISVFHSR